MSHIYLDYAASTPIHDDVLAEIIQSLTKQYGNASSIHRQGRESKLAIDMARETMCTSINAQPLEIFFTSGGTESDNMAIAGFLSANHEKGNHIITSEMEHPAVLNTIIHYQNLYGFDVSFVDVKEDGGIDMNHFKTLLNEDTIFCSIMYVNNETGVINPIPIIAEICKKNKITFHTDAVQAFGKIAIDVKELRVDMLSVSSHKIYGPKGAGFTYVKKGVKIDRINYGGSQEFDKRSGTENVNSIVGFGKAVEISQSKIELEYQRITELKTLFLKLLKKEITDYHINGEPEISVPHIINVSFANCSPESLVMNLDENDIFVSSGSACASGSRKASKVIQKIPMDDVYKKTPIRFSFGKDTTEKDIKTTISALKDALKYLRNLS